MKNEIRIATEVIKRYQERGDIDPSEFERILDNYLDTLKSGYEADVESMVLNYMRSRDLDARGSDQDYSRQGYAGGFNRFAATVIDFGVLLVITAILHISLRTVLGVHADVILHNHTMLAILGLIIGWTYFTACERSKWMGTPGKKVLGLRVVSLRGYPPTHKVLTLRFACQALCILSGGVGWLAMFASKKHQGLHDLMSKTMVVKRDFVPVRDREGDISAAPVGSEN